MIMYLPLYSQWQFATVSDDSRVVLSEISAPDLVVHEKKRDGQNYQLRPGYPLAFPADPVFKNFRNITLADLDGDGADEMFFGVADRLYAVSGDTVKWTKTLSGLCRWPVAIGDVDGDNIPEIVALTGFSESPGQVYVLEPDGSDKPSWPRSFEGHWMLSSPALADLDADGVLDIICSDLQGTIGDIYAMRGDGTRISAAWPVTLPNIPAVTPSIGDLDLDGKPEIVVCTTREIYALEVDGRVRDGWPYANGSTKFSFQSPLVADVTSDSGLEVIATGHGDLPQYLLLDYEGKDLEGWPKAVPERRWTFHPPTVINYLDNPLILTARPLGDQDAKPMLFAWRPDGSQLTGFPVVKSGGLEGLITVADIDDDLQPEILFPSNIIDSLGNGFIHAWELDGSGQVPGYPIKMRGWTYLNGATIGDVDADGNMDLAVLTFVEHPDDVPDTAFLYTYSVESPFERDRVLWSTYKGSNRRDGLVETRVQTSTVDGNKDASFLLFPNPASDLLVVRSFSEFGHGKEILFLKIVDSSGLEHLASSGRNQYTSLDIAKLRPGVYYLIATFDTGQIEVRRWIKH